MQDEITDFGSWLRQRRKSLDLTQHELAEQVGCSVVTIRKIEAGDRRPSKQIGAALLRRLEVTLDHSPALLRMARRGGAPPDPARPLPSALESAHPATPPRPRRLLGRERTIAEVCAYLRGGARLLTLTGSGGIGKTCLSLGVIDAMRGAFAPVIVVALAQINDPNLVLPAIAQAIGIVAQPGEPVAHLRDRLHAALGSQRALLVLDNFEHLLDAALTVGNLLEAAPHLTILVTSRAALNLRQEQLFPVPPLAVPAPELSAAPALLEQYAAVALFVECARAVRPDFCLTAANAADVVELCRRLDGLPLAIELAAARVRLLSPAALLSHLSAGLGVLAGGPVDVPERHQTLCRTIDWSYQLLSEPEQRLFAGLGIFAGGCSLEAINAVGQALLVQARAAGGVAARVGAPDLLDSLASLVDKSLVRQYTGVDGDSRLSLLEMLRAYALGQLRELDLAEVAARQHAAHYCALAEAAEDGLSGAEQLAWISRLEQEHDNLRAALRWAIDAADAELGLRLVAALWRFWYVRSYFTEGRDWLGQALALPSGPAHALWRTRALNGAGNLAYKQGDFAAAWDLHQQSLLSASERSDLRGIAGSLNNLGLIARKTRRHPYAVALFEEAITLNRKLGNRAWEAINLNNLGIAMADVGQLSTANALQEQSLAIFTALGSTWGVAMALCDLGTVAYQLGAVDQAQDCYMRSLERRLQLGDEEGTAMCLHSLGVLAADSGDHTLAASLFGESLALARQHGNRDTIAWGLIHLARSRAALGDPAGAAQLQAEAEQFWHSEDPAAGSQRPVKCPLIPASWPEGCPAPFGPCCQPPDE